MSRFVRLALAAATAAALGLVAPQAAGAAGKTPEWVKHIQKYPGGISNGVRAYVAVEAAGRQAVPPTTTHGVTGNQQINGDCSLPLPQDETSVAYSLDDPLTAVAGANDYCSAGSQIMTTHDGGLTWSSQTRRPFAVVANRGCGGGDPAIAYSQRDHAFYMANLCTSTIGGLSEVHVWKSVDGGDQWTPVRMAAVVASNRVGGSTNTHIFLDKEWIVVDNNPGSPHYGRVYVTYIKFHFDSTGFGDYCPVQLNYTDEIPTDDPSQAVWQHTSVVADDPGGPGEGEHANQWAYPQVEADGTLDVSYALEDCNTGLDRHLKLQKSFDGGASFLASPLQIDKPGQFEDNHNLDDTLPPTVFRTPLSPSLNYNGVTGTLAYAYQNNVNHFFSGADISYQLSHDGGYTWTDAAFLSVDDSGSPAPNDQFFPWVTSAPDGGFHAIWFDRRLDSANRRIDTWQADSSDDGVTWTSYRISTRSWDPVKGFFDCGCFIGDYNGVAASSAAIYPIWTDGRNTAIAQTGVGETDIFTNIELLD